jgi:hypothetical protein
MGRRSRNRVRAGVQSPTARREPVRGSGSESSRRTDRTREIEIEVEIEEEIDRLFLSALRMFDFGEGAQAGHELATLALLWSQGVGGVRDILPPFVPEILWLYLYNEVELAWRRGWQPADIPRVTTRVLSANHTRLAVNVIADQAESYRSRQRVLPSWMDQLDQIDATVRWTPGTDHLALFAEANGIDLEDLLRIGLDLLIVIKQLPKIPLLDPPPSEWDASAALDAAVAWRKREMAGELRHLERVRALLAKAESTQFEEEAEAFTEKAQELMTRYSIDSALLAAHAAGKLTEPQPRGVRLGIDDPYSQAKATLLSTIANASGCRALWSKNLGFSTVFGFEGELKSVELLYTSLLLQARRSMMRTGKAGSHARSRSFRQSFLAGFANRIGKRLEQSASDAISEALKEEGGALVPVLAGRSRVVDECRDEAFPEFGEFRPSASDWLGWVSGTEAADEAEIVRGPLLDETA